MRRVAVTGIGIINPAGLGKDAFWKNVTAGVSAIKRIERFAPDEFPSQVAGEMVNFRAEDFFPRRMKVRTDTFIHYALAASSLALQDAKLDLTKQDPYRAGIFFGNNSGGWDISERGWKEYHQEGPSQTNPWQATAWFPTGAQGFTSIYYNIKGCSKSFVCDRASGAFGLYFGFRSVGQGENDFVLAGGTEAPISRLGLTCYIGTGDLVKEPEGAYKPFDKNRSGLVLGEGSTVMVLEDLTSAQHRGIPIYGEILGAACATDYDPTKYTALTSAMRKALNVASVDMEEIDLILAEGCGTQVGDRAEAQAIIEVFGARAFQVPISIPKTIYGHQYGASCATELACGLLSMQENIMPLTLSYTDPNPEYPFHIVTRSEQQHISKVLINARSREGVNVSLIIGAVS